MWLDWFAWRPVLMTNGNVAWLKTVQWNLMADPRAPFTRALYVYRPKS